MMTAKNDYERRKAEQEATREKRNSENWRKKLKDPMIFFNGLLAIFTLGLVYVAEKTDQTLKATLAASRLSQRAWVALDIKMIDDESFQYSLAGGGKIKLDVTLTNTGNEPAAIGWTEINLLPDLIGQTQDFKYVKAECEKMRATLPNPQNSHGFIFPKGTQSFPYTAGISAEDLKRSLVGTKSFVPLIAGCVTYTFVNGEGGQHQTGFVYYLKRKDDRFFYVDEVSTPSAMLKFEPWIVGGFYAD